MYPPAGFIRAFLCHLAQHASSKFMPVPALKVWGMVTVKEVSNTGNGPAVIFPDPNQCGSDSLQCPDEDTVVIKAPSRSFTDGDDCSLMAGGLISCMQVDGRC